VLPAGSLGFRETANTFQKLSTSLEEVRSYQLRHCPTTIAWERMMPAHARASTRQHKTTLARGAAYCAPCP
jgi:hypothetical protein